MHLTICLYFSVAGVGCYQRQHAPPRSLVIVTCFHNVLFSHSLSSCFVGIVADLCYDHVYRHGAELHTTSWSTINRQFVDITGDVLALIDLILTIPATSVETERGFSVMKRVKTDYRNKLRNPAMNDLMRIILLSPSEAAFDPAPAIEHWYGALQHLGSVVV